MVTCFLAHLLQLYTLLVSVATFCPKTGTITYPWSFASMTEEQRQMLMAYLYECLELYFNGSTPFPPTFIGGPFLREVYGDKFFHLWFMNCVQKSDPRYLITNTFRFIDDHLKLWIHVSMAPEFAQDAILQFLASVPVYTMENPCEDPETIHITIQDVHRLCNPAFMEKLSTLLWEKSSVDDIDVPRLIIAELQLFRVQQTERVALLRQPKAKK